MKSKKNYTDLELVSMIREGGRKMDIAFEQIYRYSGIPQKIENQLKKMGSREELAHDIMQESMVAVYSNIREGKYKSESSLATYAISIAKFKWLKWLRDHGNHDKGIIPIEDLKNSMASEDDNKKRKEKKIIEKLLDLATENCRQLLVLYLDEFSPKEIAEKIGKQYQTIRNNISTCYQDLRNKVEGYLDFLDEEE